MEQTNLQTPRLLLRNFRRTDRDDLYAYLSLKSVVEYEPYEVQSYDECTHLALERENRADFIAICLGERMIGNLYFAKNPFSSGVFELGYILNPEFWGMGYATESCKCLIEHAFKSLGAKKIVAYCNPQNEKSWKLLERIGMKRSVLICHDVYFKFDENNKPVWHDTYEYKLTKHRFCGGVFPWK